MEGVTFSFRVGERAGYSEQEPELLPEQYYAVALIETPGPPGDAHPESRGFAVIAMQRYRAVEGQKPGEILWGWVHITADTKKLIGLDLLENEATPGIWYYLVPTFQDSTIEQIPEVP